MKRWLLTALVVLLPLTGLFVLWRRSSEPPSWSEPTDELLAYELASGRSLDLRLPGALDDVLLTTWCIVEPQVPYDATTRYVYALNLSFVDRDGHVVKTRRFEPETRVSIAGRSEAAGKTASAGNETAEYAAKLADSDAWVTDSRTVSVLTGDALPKGGSLHLELEPGGVGAVLIRPTYRQRRSAIERQAYEQSLTIDARHRLDNGRTSLGFDDLPLDARERAVATWGRRLDAVGKAGIDFQVRRLLIGNLRTMQPVALGLTTSFEIGPRHSAALNFDRPVSFDLVVPPGKRVHLSGPGGSLVGLQGAESQVVGGESFIHVTEAGKVPYTVVVEGEAGDDFRVGFILGSEEAKAQIGALPVTPRESRDGGLVQIRPDVRVARFYRLSPETPVVTRIAHGQEILRVLIRGEMGQGDSHDEIRGEVTARWVDAGGATHAQHVVKLSTVLPHSKFERWRGGGDS